VKSTAWAASGAWAHRDVGQYHALAPADAGYDADGDALTLAIAAAAQHGTAAVDQGALQVRYTPAARYLGDDAFTFSLDDGAGAVPYTLQLAVARVVTCAVTPDCGGGEVCKDGLCQAGSVVEGGGGGGGCGSPGGAGGAALPWALLALPFLARRRRGGA
jgi:hypothetical protein